MWIALKYLKDFTIAALRLPTAVEKLDHPSILTSAKVLELYRKVSSL